MSDQRHNPAGADDEHLVLVLTDMLERRTESVQAQPDLARVRSDARRSPASSGSSESSLGGGQATALNRGPYLLAVAAAIVLVLVGGAVILGSRSNSIEGGPASDIEGGDTDGGDDSTTTSSIEVSTTTVPTTATEPAPTGSTIVESTTTTAAADETQEQPTNQAEPDLRFDFGDIVRFERIDGVDWIWFDRWGFSEEQLQGPDHQSEPRYSLASDWHGGLNVNSALRSYPLAPTAEVLQLDPVISGIVCGGDQYSGTAFFTSDVPSLLAAGANNVSLTFDDDNRVVLIRDQTAC